MTFLSPNLQSPNRLSLLHESERNNVRSSSHSHVLLLVELIRHRRRSEGHVHRELPQQFSAGRVVSQELVAVVAGEEDSGSGCEHAAAREAGSDLGQLPCNPSGLDIERTKDLLVRTLRRLTIRATPELDYLVGSEAGRTVLSENYVGLPYEKFD